MDEFDRVRIERVLMGYGWYYRNLLMAKARGDRNEIAYWENRTMDYQRGVQRADPLGKWPMRFTRVCRELESEVYGGQCHDRTLGENDCKRLWGESTCEGDRPASPRRRRRRDGYAEESGDDALRRAAYEYMEIVYDILRR